MKTESTHSTDHSFSIQRQAYEAQFAQRVQTWQQEIQQLANQATQHDVPESVGNEQTQVQKLQGQWEMILVQFDQLRAVNTQVAWAELRTGLEQKADEFEETLARTLRRIEQNRASEG
jgi:hypothetical protein